MTKECYCKSCSICKPIPKNCIIKKYNKMIELMAIALVDTIEMDGTYFQNRKEVIEYYANKTERVGKKIKMQGRNS